MKQFPEKRVISYLSQPIAQTFVLASGRLLFGDGKYKLIRVFRQCLLSSLRFFEAAMTGGTVGSADVYIRVMFQPTS